MKKIVITGKGSYIGNHIKEWLENAGDYSVEEIDVESEEWRKFDFSNVESIVHVAGIVHRPNVLNWDLYERVNVKLPVEVAKMAKRQGVKQLVFLSTMAVYGHSKKLSRNVIYSDTLPHPINMYGKSKFMAEKQLKLIEDESFKVAIVRPPNVYGRGCKGNYISKFTHIVKKLPVLPCAYTHLKQSMIYIDNLSNFIKMLIEDEASGVYMPQDRESVSAVELMEAISVGIKRPLKKSKCVGIGVVILHWLPIIRKAYGGIEYDGEVSKYRDKDYVVISFQEAIRKTVVGV